LDAHDSKEARAILDSILERMMAAVHSHMGIINRVMGDGIVTLFGVPVAHEYHAVQVGDAD
jgi:class 3 adenylate cyclase